MHVIQENDVLFGRGNLAKNFPGNRVYRSLVSERKEEYTKTESHHVKQRISEEIYDHIKSLDPPGSFVQENIATNQWEPVSKKDAVRKITQALREKKTTSGCLGGDGSHVTMDETESNKSSKDTVQPHAGDVVYGRGNHLKTHVGNIKYRDLVQALKEHYVTINKKHIVSALVYNAIRNQIPSGRFLIECSDGHCEELEPNAALKKISQCLREGQRSVKTTISPLKINRSFNNEELEEITNEMNRILQCMGYDGSSHGSGNLEQQASPISVRIEMTSKPSLETEDTSPWFSDNFPVPPVVNSSYQFTTILPTSGNANTCKAATSAVSVSHVSRPSFEREDTFASLDRLFIKHSNVMDHTYDSVYHEARYSVEREDTVALIQHLLTEDSSKMKQPADTVSERRPSLEREDTINRLFTKNMKSTSMHHTTNSMNEGQYIELYEEIILDRELSTLSLGSVSKPLDLVDYHFHDKGRISDVLDVPSQRTSVDQSIEASLHGEHNKAVQFSKAILGHRLTTFDSSSLSIADNVGASFEDENDGRCLDREMSKLSIDFPLFHKVGNGIDDYEYRCLDREISKLSIDSQFLRSRRNVSFSNVPESVDPTDQDKKSACYEYHDDRVLLRDLSKYSIDEGSIHLSMPSSDHPAIDTSINIPCKKEDVLSILNSKGDNDFEFFMTTGPRLGKRCLDRDRSTRSTMSFDLTPQGLTDDLSRPALERQDTHVLVSYFVLDDCEKQPQRQHEASLPKNMIKASKYQAKKPKSFESDDHEQFIPSNSVNSIVLAPCGQQDIKTVLDSDNPDLDVLMAALPRDRSRMSKGGLERERSTSSSNSTLLRVFSIRSRDELTEAVDL